MCFCRSATIVLTNSWEGEATTILMMLKQRLQARRSNVSTVGPSTPSPICKLNNANLANNIFFICSCVKTLKSLGFTAVKGNGNKIPIQSLTKDKIKKLSNLRVI